jgi:hypothetical protein
VTKDMLDLAKHIVNQKAGHFEPDKFEEQHETALIDLINQKRSGKPITAKERPRGENVVDLMDALRKSIGAACPAASKQGLSREEGRPPICHPLGVHSLAELLKTAPVRRYWSRHLDCPTGQRGMKSGGRRVRLRGIRKVPTLPG